MVDLRLAYQPSRQGKSVSVIVPCYKQAHWLKECISSIRAQTHKPDEIIVAAGDYESRLAAEFLGVRTVDDGAKGLAHARNVGITASNGRYIICLDADDAIEPTYIESTLRAAGDNRLVIASTNLYEFGSGNGHWDLPRYSRQGILKQNCLTCASLFSRELWELAGGYNVALPGREDWGFWISCSRFAPVVVQIQERLLRYRMHADSMTIAHREAIPILDAAIKIAHPLDYSVKDLLDSYLVFSSMGEKQFRLLFDRYNKFPDNSKVLNFLALACQGRGDHEQAKYYWELMGPKIGPVT